MSGGFVPKEQPSSTAGWVSSSLHQPAPNQKPVFSRVGGNMTVRRYELLQKRDYHKIELWLQNGSQKLVATR
jgi:hypothetical protein